MQSRAECRVEMLVRVNVLLKLNQRPFTKDSVDSAEHQRQGIHSTGHHFRI